MASTIDGMTIHMLHCVLTRAWITQRMSPLSCGPRIQSDELSPAVVLCCWVNATGGIGLRAPLLPNCIYHVPQDISQKILTEILMDLPVKGVSSTEHRDNPYLGLEIPPFLFTLALHGTLWHTTFPSTAAASRPLLHPTHCHTAAACDSKPETHHGGCV